MKKLMSSCRNPVARCVCCTWVLQSLYAPCGDGRTAPGVIVANVWFTCKITDKWSQLFLTTTIRAMDNSAQTARCSANALGDCPRKRRHTLEASFREGSPSLLTSKVSSAASPSGFFSSSSHAARRARSLTHSKLSLEPDSSAAMKVAYLHAPHLAPQDCCYCLTLHDIA